MSTADALRPDEEVRLFRASAAQARMWFEHRRDPRGARYNVFLAARVRGPLDADLLTAALGDVVARHEPLRTTFTELDGELHQVVSDTVRAPLSRQDVAPADLADHLRAAATGPFDLAAGTPLRAHLCATGPDEHVLLLVMHHIVVDGWSLEILFRDLGRAYRARLDDTAPALPPLELHYADIAEWELDRFAEGAADAGLDHWRTALTPPPPPLALPVDRLRTADPLPDAGRTPLRLSAQTSRGLRALARDRSTTLSTVLLTLYAALLGRWCDTSDLVVGIPAAGRTRTETEEMVGLFVNTLPVRCRLGDDPALTDAVDAVRDAALAAFEHQDVPLDAVVSALRPPRPPGRSPLFDVLFTLQNTGGVALDLPGAESAWIEVDTSWTRFDLEVDFWDEEAVHGMLVHRTSLFTDRTAREFADALTRLADAAAADPGARLSALLPDTALPGRDRTPGEAEAAAERALLDLPGVADAVVLPVTAADGAREWTAVAVPDAPLTEERVLAAARRAAPGLDVTGAALVAGLPRFSDGRLDTSALSEVASLGPEAVQVWNAELEHTAPGARARLVDAPAPEPGLRTAPDPAAGRVHRPAPAQAPGTGEPGAGQPGAEAPGTEVSGIGRPGPADGASPSLADGGPPPPLPHPDLGAALAAAAAGPHGVTFVDARGDRSHLPYRDLYTRARAVLGALRARGLDRGDRVLIRFRDNASLVPVLWGCLLGGLAAVPWAVPAEPGADDARRLHDTWERLGRPLLVLEEALEPLLRPLLPDGAAAATDTELHRGGAEDVPAPVPPDTDALLLLTSGSTGAPKAVRLTHRMVLTRSAAALKVCGVGADDVSLNWMPLDHVGGVAMFHIRDAVAGCAQVQAATPWVLADPLRWIDLADAFTVTTTWAPNFAFGLVAEEAERRGGGWDLRALRHILNGGEAVVARTARAFLRALAPHGLPQDAVRPAWGMSETSSGQTDNDRFHPDTTSDDDPAVEVGRPYPGFAMRVVGPDGAPVPEGAPGRLQVTGDAVTPGYFADPDRTAEAFTPDGWFETGDLAVLRGGRLTITGRAKDVVILNGANHHCHDIEAAVEDRAPVLRSFTAAVGLPGGAGERLAVLFVPREGTDDDTACAAVRAAVREGTGLNPDLLVPVGTGDVPKTGIGKIRRSALRDRLLAGGFDAALARTGARNRPADTVPDRFHRPVWRREARLHAPDPVRSVLLAAADGPGTRALARALAASGARVGTVADPADLPAALADRPDRIVVVDEVPEPGGGAEAAARLAVDVAVGHRSLLRAVADHHDGSTPLTVSVLTRGVLDAPGGDPLRLPVQVLPGLWRSAAQELPGTAYRLLDAAAGTPEEEVAAELLSGERTPEVALRPGGRWVRRLAPAPPGEGWAPAPGDPVLVTGGLGGVGAHVSRSLLAGYGARLLLLGRTPPADAAARLLEDLRARFGPDRVRHAVGDATDAAALRAAVEHAEREWGAPLAGALHLAGDFAEEPLAGTDDAGFARLLHAKAVGAGVLADLLAERPGAALVAFSSVNGFLGAPSAAAYAAANSFLDGFAAASADAPGPRRSIGWTMWDETGLSRGYALKDRTRDRGSTVLSPEEARRSLVAALRTGGPHVLAGLDPSRPWVRSHTLPGPLAVRAAAVGPAPQGAPLPLTDRHGTPVPLVAASAEAGTAGPARPRGALERLVADTWAEVLRTDAIGPDDGFFDLGGASLQMSRVHGLLQMRLGREIDLVDLFRHPTVAAVAAFLSRTAGPEAPDTGAADRGRDRAAARRARRGRRR